MTLNDDLIAWNARWRLSSGVDACKTCQSYQLEVDKRVPFHHHPGCVYFNEIENPWGALDTIVQGREK